MDSTFESIIIKNILEDKKYFNKVKPILNKKIFSEYSNGLVYQLIYDYYEKYNALPSTQELGILVKDIPNKETRKQVADSIIKSRNVENIKKDFLDDETVKFVKDQMFTQALMMGAEFIDKKDESYKIKAKELIDNSQLISINADLGTCYDDIENRIDYYQNPQKGLKYLRFQTLNKFIGEGFLKGTLNLFMAPAGVGKSLLMSTSIGDFLLQKKNILLVSMEMSNFEFLKRVDADLLDIQINLLKDVEKNVIFNKFNDIKDKIGKLFVQNYPAGSFSANDLAALIEMYSANNIKLDAVFLDYLGLMKSDKVSPSTGLYSYIKSIGEEVRAVAKNYELIVFSASQLNRSAVNNTEVNNESISDSMGTAMTADWICFLLQTETMKKENVISFKITKNRYNGRTGGFKMNINYNNMRLEDSGVLPNEEEELIRSIDDVISEKPKLNAQNNLGEWNHFT